MAAGLAVGNLLVEEGASIGDDVAVEDADFVWGGIRGGKCPRSRWCCDRSLGAILGLIELLNETKSVIESGE